MSFDLGQLHGVLDEGRTTWDGVGSAAHGFQRYETALIMVGVKEDTQPRLVIPGQPMVGSDGSSG